MNTFNENIQYNEIALAFGAKMIPLNDYPYEITNTPLGELFVKTLSALSKEATVAYKFISKLKENDPSLTPGRILGKNRDIYSKHYKYEYIYIPNIFQVSHPNHSFTHSLMMRLPEGAVSINANGTQWSYFDNKKLRSLGHQVDMYVTGQLLNMLEVLSEDHMTLRDTYIVYMQKVREELIKHLDEKISWSLRKYNGQTGFMTGYLEFAEAENPVPNFIYQTFDESPIELSEIQSRNEIMETQPEPLSSVSTTTTQPFSLGLQEALKFTDTNVNFNDETQWLTNESTIEYIVRVGVSRKLASGSYSLNLGVNNSAQNSQLNPDIWVQKLTLSGIQNVSVDTSTDRECIRIDNIDSLTPNQASLLVELFKIILRIKAQ